jgi:hypothetical protein
MGLDVTGLKMLHIPLDHLLLSLIGAVLPRLFQVHLGFFEVWFEFTIFQKECLALERNSVLGLVSINASNSNNIFLINFESSGVEDINALSKEKSLNHSEVVLSHVSREVASDSTLVWEVQLCEGLVDVEDFLLNLRVEFVNNFFVEAARVVVARIGQEDLMELISGQVGDEFVVAEVVVVTHIGIKTCDICNKLLVVLS